MKSEGYNDCSYESLRDVSIHITRHLQGQSAIPSSVIHSSRTIYRCAGSRRAFCNIRSRVAVHCNRNALTCSFGAHPAGISEISCKTYSKNRRVTGGIICRRFCLPFGRSGDRRGGFPLCNNITTIIEVFNG